MMVLIETPMVLTNWSMKARWTSLNLLNEASSITPSTWSSKRIGRMTMLAGRRGAEPGVDGDVVRRDVVDEDALLLQGGLGDQPAAGVPEPGSGPLLGPRRCRSRR